VGDCGGSTAALLGFRSGLECWLEAFRCDLRAPLNLPTGDGERFGEPSAGARSELVTTVGADSEAASLSELLEVFVDRGVRAPSRPANGADPVGRFAERTSGDEVVRKFRCDECVDSGGGVSKGL
jgi:hypothetical protein